MPRPLRRILSPFFRLLAIISITWVSISLAWRLGSSCAADSCSAMWRRVRIALLEVPVAFFAALGAAFGAAAFASLLAAVPAGSAALAGPDFDAAALRAGAFLAVVLVAAFAIDEILLMRGQFSSHSMDEGI